jgi:uncharacterized protein YciI
MNYFLYKLNSPRPTFPADMAPAEAEFMRAHVAYWSGLMDQGMVIAFGPVADPAGSYGMAILRLTEAADASALGAGDPAIVANAGFSFEVHSMPRLMFAAKQA